jgi:peptidoglycan hydrolase-like protein with peptidoglycan-binding domain
MKKQMFVLLCLCLGVVYAMPHHVEAASSVETLARMDAVIAEMQKLRAEFALLVSAAATPLLPSTGSVLGASLSTVLTDDLSYGATNDSITKIQKLFATDSEIYGDGTISGFFGPKTQDALRRFQVRFGLDPVGVVGPSTKAILEAFMAKYPNDTYPTGVLKGGVPQVGVLAAPAVVPVTQVTPTTGAQSTVSTISAITLDGEDGEVIAHSRNTDGSRNRDLILYPEDEDELVEMIAAKLKVTESLVRSLVDLDDANLDGGSNQDEEDANDALDAAEQAIEDAEDAIDEAKDDGDDTADAEDLLDEAYDALDDAEEAFDDEDYADAEDLAKDARNLAKDAEDEL